MKLLFLAGAILLASSSLSVAQTTATGTGNANSSSNSRALAISGGGQGGQGGLGGQGGTGQGGTGVGRGGNANSSIIFNTPGNTTSNNNSNSRLRQSGSLSTTPNAIAPGLAAAGIESCQGSISAAGSVTGFGLSFGGPIMDRECNLRLWARTLYAMGQRELVGGVLAQSDVVNKAIQIVDQQRQPNGQVVYGAAGSARPYASANSSGLINQGCKKWSGGSTGVGSCLY